MGTVRIVNMIPNALSGETNPGQRAEHRGQSRSARPISSGRRSRPPRWAAAFAPIYVSTDGGSTWALRNVVPGNGTFGTKDITVAFAPTGGMLYAGTLNGSNAGRLMQILRTTNFTSTTPMTVMMQRTGPDQPWVITGPASGAGDRLYVGNNNLGTFRTAFVDVCLNASASSPGFMGQLIERRQTGDRTDRRCGLRSMPTARSTPPSSAGPRSAAPTSTSTSSSCATISLPGTSTSSSIWSTLRTMSRASAS